MVCKKCGTEFPGDAKICYKCKEIQPNARLCQNCGKVIDRKCTICPKCGRKVIPVQRRQLQRPQVGTKEPKKPIYAKWWIWAIVVLLVIGAIGNISNKNANAE